MATPVFNIEQNTLNNSFYRKVLFTSPNPYGIQSRLRSPDFLKKSKLL